MSDFEFNFVQHYPQDERKFGEYLKRSGSPLFCRVDIRLTSLEELRWAAVVISDLNKQLNHLAYEAEGDKIMRVIMARDAMQSARYKLRYVKRVTEQKAQPVKSKAKGTTRGSVSWPIQVGKLDRAEKSPETDQTTGENDVE